MTHSLEELKEAANLVEKAAFDLADKVPSTVISELIVTAADLERMIAMIAKHPARAH